MDTEMFTISVEAFEVVNHILTLGYAAMGSALLYFVLTKNQNMPKYRMSSVLSVVVMVSALLLLFSQQNSWSNAYTFTGSAYALREGAELFTNGYRYLNWLIDVPMLLIQILFVAGIAGVARRRYMVQFSTAGSLMIITGYIGQYYEPGRINEGLGAWLVWGTISTVFFIWVLVLITRVIKEGQANMQGSGAQKLFGRILPLFFVSWFLYPGAYLMPLLLEWGIASYGFAIVAQQITFTVADISSKIIYGAMLNAVSTQLSQEQGFKEDQVVSSSAA
ncbi:MAG: rhodopsin [Spirochaetes bacterium]|jgi:bacteriorhodopsin|nr:rhodopsin [Spirochaetota bacterium]